MLTRHDFNRHWSPLLRIFRLFGLTHFYSADGRSPGCSAFGAILFRCYSLGLCVHLVFLVTLIVVNIFSDATGGLSGFIKRLIFVGELLVYLVTFIESHATVRRQKGLLQQIFQLDGMLSERLGVEFGMEKFCRKWKWILCTTSVVLLTIIIGPAITFGNEGLDMVMVFFIPTMIAQVRMMQVAVFVDCLAEMLNRLMVVVRREQRGDRGLMAGDGSLRECMEVYSKLLKMAATISRTFGWSMLPILGLKICEWINTWYLSMFNTYVGKSVQLHVCK